MLYSLILNFTKIQSFRNFSLAPSKFPVSAQALLAYIFLTSLSASKLQEHRNLLFSWPRSIGQHHLGTCWELTFSATTTLDLPSQSSGWGPSNLGFLKHPLPQGLWWLLSLKTTCSAAGGDSAATFPRGLLMFRSLHQPERRREGGNFNDSRRDSGYSLTGGPGCNPCSPVPVGAS